MFQLHILFSLIRSFNFSGRSSAKGIAFLLGDPVCFSALLKKQTLGFYYLIPTVTLNGKAQKSHEKMLEMRRSIP